MPQNQKFVERVWSACRKIPKGRVSTYSALARAIGAPRASRAVGNALNVSPGMPRVPCHRVVRANGEVGGFACGVKAKTALLAKEGVKTRKGRIVGFKEKLAGSSSVRLKQKHCF